MGGDCLNTGCVPSKALIKSATRRSRRSRNAQDYGITQATRRVRLRRRDGARAARRRARSSRTIRSSAIPALGVECLQGDGEDHLALDGRGRDGKRTLTTRAHRHRRRRAAVRAADSRASSRSSVLTSDNVWDLRELPQRLVVLGGGPIGCELAQAFARLGSKVTQVEMLPRLLAREDPEVSEMVRGALRARRHRRAASGTRRSVRVRGREVRWSASTRAARCASSSTRCCARSAASPNTARLRPGGARHPGDQGAHRRDQRIPADALSRTSTPAATSPGPTSSRTPPRTRPGIAAVNALFGRFRRFRADYSVIPWATFTDPEVARVGLNETEAKEQRHRRTRSRATASTTSTAPSPTSAAHGMVKVLTVPGKDRILGATIVGEHAGDLIVEFVAAMKHGIGLNKILGTIHIYPTLAEANKYAAGAWKKAHAPAAACCAGWSASTPGCAAEAVDRRAGAERGAAHPRRARGARAAARARPRGDRGRRRQRATAPRELAAAAVRSRRLSAPRGRALQMNAGARAATGDVLLFLHADTRLPPDADDAGPVALKQHVWGRFDVRDRRPPPASQGGRLGDEPALAADRHRHRRPGDLRAARRVPGLSPRSR